MNLVFSIKFEKKKKNHQFVVCLIRPKSNKGWAAYRLSDDILTVEIELNLFINLYGAKYQTTIDSVTESFFVVFFLTNNIYWEYLYPKFKWEGRQWSEIDTTTYHIPFQDTKGN